jgi:hypothetical protein
MTTEAIVLNFQATILRIASERFGRPVSEKERAYVTRHEGLIALESIHDYVSTLSEAQLEQYLNAE